MASLLSVRLNRGDASSWGFRLQGGKDFGTPLVIQKVIGGSPAERAGLMAGDAVCRINNTDVTNLRHKDAQDVIIRAGPSFEVAVQRGGSSWKPSVTPIGSLPSPRPAAPVNNVSPVTSTSLAAGRQESIGAIGTGHNVSAKPFGAPQLNGGPKLVSKQYNSPLPLYSEQSIAETLSAQSEVLANGVLGVNFKKNEKSYDSEKSAVFRMLQEAENDPRDESVNRSNFYDTHSHAIGGGQAFHHKDISSQSNDYQNQTRSSSSFMQSNLHQKPNPANQQITICTDCERVIVGVFVRIKDKNLHVECFKCSTCGTSLKNVGYYNLNNKLYCDVHAKLAAKNNPPAPNLTPITIPPGGKIPAGTISAALSSHSLPSPAPLSPSVNFSAAPYQPSSLSSPRPFSSVNAPLSPSLPKTSPITPAAPIAEKSSVQNIVWPPVQEKSELPTASPLYFPPPSQVEPILSKKAAEKLTIEYQQEEENRSLCEFDEEVSYYDQKANDMAFYSSAVSSTKSTEQCTETISDTIETQQLVESIIKSKPKSPPQITPRDVSVTVTILESQLKQAHCNTLAASSETVGCKTTQSTETKTSLIKEQQQTLASMYEKKIKVENSVPHKYETPMVVALTVASDKPYEQIASIQSFEQETKSTFEQIPEKTSHSALATALATAPAVPFTPSNQISLEPIPLPEETVPYFPPEHPIVSEEVLKHAVETNKQSFKNKKVKEDEELFKDLPKPPAEKISLLSALTTAPERPYSPIGIETPSYQTVEQIPLKESQIEVKKDSNSLRNFALQNQSKSQNTASHTFKAESSNLNVNRTNKTSSYEVDKNQQDIRKQKEIKFEESSSKAQTVSKNVHSENVSTIQSSGMPPMIQMVRSSFETKTDKVQMEMTCCQCPQPVIHTEITEKTNSMESNTVKDKSTVQKSISDNITEHKSSSKSQRKTTEATEKSKLEKLDKLNKKSISKNVDQSLKSNIVDVQRKQDEVVAASESALLQKAIISNQNLQTQGIKAQVAKTNETVAFEKPSLQKPVTKIQNSSQAQQIQATQLSKISEVNYEAATLQKERVKIVQPGQTNLNIPQISFQPVIDEPSAPSTTFSPRPRSITPSMINKPAPVIPYYQASLAAMECLPVRANVLDPTTPTNSRSPSPCLGRPSSPFPSTNVRPVSPAQGPPPNPLHVKKTATQLLHEEKVKDAKYHLEHYIPQHQSKHADAPPINYCSTSTTFQRTFDVDKSNKQNMSKSLASKNEFQSASAKSTETASYQNVQIQKTKTVSEEFEHVQKCSTIQTEQQRDFCSSAVSATATTSSCAHRQCSVQSNLQKNDKQSAAGFHVTNPQPIKSPFMKASADQDTTTNKQIKSVPSSDVPKKQIIPVQLSSSAKPPGPKPFPSSSGSAPAANAAASLNKNLSRPNTSQPNVGTGGGGGRQAGAIGVAPKRGRGVLNLAAGPGSRVPLCAQCHNHIRGPFITALGKIWCPDHFICATASCRRPLHDLGFVEERGQLYCEYCFEQYLAPPCAKCGAKVKGDCLKAIGKNFHPECFNCVYCGKLFGNSPFFLEDCQPYCEADWNELFTTKCFACGFPVEAGDRWVEALNNNYHSQCFNCTMCKKNLEGQSFFAKGGRPFCKNHAR